MVDLHHGYRFVCRRDGDRVRVFSRNVEDWTDRVPLIVEAMLALPVKSATIDGEGVVGTGAQGSGPGNFCLNRERTLDPEQHVTLRRGNLTVSKPMA
jgi:ATP-dependent DNA ligase